MRSKGMIDQKLVTTHQGQHWICDCWGCRRGIDDPEGAESVVRQTVDVMGATLLDLRVHVFKPHGFTAVAVLAESHIAIHTWPERDHVAIDAFTCGRSMSAEEGIRLLCEFFAPEEFELKCLRRFQSPLDAQTESEDARNRPWMRAQ